MNEIANSSFGNQYAAQEFCTGNQCEDGARCHDPCRPNSQPIASTIVPIASTIVIVQFLFTGPPLWKRYLPFAGERYQLAETAVNRTFALALILFLFCFCNKTREGEPNVLD
jgi:hypothetical protein